MTKDPGSKSAAVFTPQLADAVERARRQGRNRDPYAPAHGEWRVLSTMNTREEIFEAVLQCHCGHLVLGSTLESVKAGLALHMVGR